VTNRLFCRLDGLTPEIREEKRFEILSSLGLLESNIIPVFEEATQTAAHFLETPLCWLSLLIKDHFWIKASFGLSRMGLMNQLATSRYLSREDALCCYVADSEQNLKLENALSDRFFGSNILVQHYGIQAYLGTPLITAEGQCIGVLAALDLQPHQFSDRDQQFLALTARWCLREYEREHFSRFQTETKPELFKVISPKMPETTPRISHSTNRIKSRLLEQLTQQLRNPLTSVIGMASVLLRGVYGELNEKQQEYLEIIYNSGQNLSSLIDEIINLGAFEESESVVNQTPTDLEMICQQAINNLTQIGKQHHQEIHLTVEPGQRVWLLDKDKVRQALYYLIISILGSAEVGGQIRVHVSRKTNSLNIAVWLSHPWLGEGLYPLPGDTSLVSPILTLGLDQFPTSNEVEVLDIISGGYVLTSQVLSRVAQQIEENPDQSSIESLRELLGLLLASHLIEIQGGQIVIQGSVESGYRYILKLPKISD
jgi:signal transduction histidine kinase